MNKLFFIFGSFFFILSCSAPYYAKINNMPNFVVAECGGYAYEDSLYTCTVNASDRDISLNWMATEDEVLQYSLEDAPLGMEIDPNTGEISWTPVDSQADKYTHIKVAVTDILGAVDYQEFDIFVYRINDAPLLISTCSNTATEDILYGFKLEVLDEENDAIEFVLSEKPDGMEINKDGGIS